MLTTDVRFEGWTNETWTRFLSVWKPRAAPHLEPSRPRGAVVCVHADGRLRKLVHTHHGRLDPTDVAWPCPLPELAERYRSSWVLSLESGALEEVMERFGARMRRTDDLTEQSLLLAQVFGELLDEGRIARWPKRLEGLALPGPQTVDRVLESLCPHHHAMVLGLFHEGELWTALAARRRAHGFDVIAGPEDLRASMGLLSGDWRRDYRHLARAVEERYAPLGMGLFADTATFKDLLTDTRPGAWSRAYAVRSVVLAPIPPGLGLALGVDGARYAYEGLRILTGRIEAFQAAEPLFAAVRQKLGEVVGDRDIGQLLGFDPMAALRALISR